MAKILSKVGITTGYALESSFVTQSIDAFIGGEAYDISLSGSFNMTGSTFITGSLTVEGITNLNQSTIINGNITLNNTTITGSLLSTGSVSTVGNLTTAGLITGTNIIATSGGGLSVGGGEFGGDLNVAGNSILGTTTVNGNITGSSSIIVGTSVSGSTIIGRKNGMSQNNSGGAVNITMTTATYPPDSIIAITQTTSNNAVAFTLPEPVMGLEYTFLATSTSTGTGTTTFNTDEPLLNGVFICSNGNLDKNDIESMGFNQTKFIKGTRVHFIAGRTTWNFTAYSLCTVSDINYS